MLSRNTYSDRVSGDTRVHEQLSDEAFLAAVVEFEHGLVEAARATGKLSDEQARAAKNATRSLELDLDELAAASVESGNPAIPIVEAIKELADDTTGIHFHASGQDAIDTALALCITRAVDILVEETIEVERKLADLAREYRSTPIIARTLGQKAVPTTFGAIAAGWLDGVRSANQIVESILMPVQYAGPAGTVSGGLDTHTALAHHLGLASHPLVWHTNRQPIVAVGGAAGRVAGAVRKVAGDIIMHANTEIGELREVPAGRSSSTPHKFTPAAAIAADSYARRTPGLMVTLLDALDCRAQQGTGSWHAEWQTVRELLATTASAVNCLNRSLERLEVDTARMAEHVGTDNPDIGNAEKVVDVTVSRRKL